EHARIRAYAHEIGVDMTAVDSISQTSEEYLPTAHGPLDAVLLDGKHAFPWPMVDWFFTAGRLEVGGMMILDDSDMRSVAVLGDFLDAEPGWARVAALRKAVAYQKLRSDVLDTSWHLQPWTCAGYSKRWSASA